MVVEAPRGCRNSRANPSKVFDSDSDYYYYYFFLMFFNFFFLFPIYLHEIDAFRVKVGNWMFNLNPNLVFKEFGLL